MKTIIIAEAGVNHDGDLKKAFSLVNIAKESGADYIKFQTFITEDILTKKAKLANYQKSNTKEKNQFKMLKKLELSLEQQKKIFNYCKKKKIRFISTAFDVKSLKFLIKLGIDYIKVPSGEITNFILLKEISKMKKKVLLSTGASSMKDISKALKVLNLKKKYLTIMHCNSSYPTPLKDVNLRVLSNLKKKFKCDIGYSDHTLNLSVPIAAVSLGAKIIEKHFTKSRKSLGPDHSSSLEPNELKKMVKSIRNIELAMGTGDKIVTRSEKKNQTLIRKSIVAIKNINKGETFTGKNISSKRPGDGINPMNYPRILGTRAKKNFKTDEKIKI